MILLALAHIKAANALDEYVPPPLFGNSQMEEPGTRPSNAIKPPPIKTQAPPKRQIKIERTPKAIEAKPQKKPGPPVINTTEKSKPKAPTTNQGMVKGPKTMPAVRKKSVEAEVTYSPNTIQPKNLIQRHKEQNAKAVIKKVEETKKTVAPVITDQTEWSFRFSDNQITLDEAQKQAILRELVPVLDLNAQIRILIFSEALAQNDANINAHRRLALNRALDVRQFLTNQAISSGRIDVRALKAAAGSATPNIVQIKIME